MDIWFQRLQSDCEMKGSVMVDELEFSVEKGNFTIKTYYPDAPISINPFKKNVAVSVPDFTIGMLIASAKAGHWLYD